MPEELPELVISSKTQSKETIAALMAAQGYETQDIIVESVTDAPPPPDPEPVVETPPEPEPQVPAGDAGGLSEQEVEELLTETPSAPAGGKKTGSQRLKEKLQAKDQENADLRAKLDALQANPPAGTPPPAAPAPAAAAPVAEAPPPTPEPEPELKPEPKWSDFEDAEDQLAAFTLASSRYAVYESDFIKAKEHREKERKEAPVKEAAAKVEAETREIQTKFRERAEVFKAERPDLDQVIQAAPAPTPMLARIVMEAEDGPKLALWLAEHPDELTTLNTQSATDDKTTAQQHNAKAAAVYESFGRIRYIMSLDSGTPAGEAPPADPPPPPATQPPPAAAPPATPAATPPKVKPSPVTPVGSRGATPNKTLAQMTQDEIRNMPPDEYRRRKEKGESFN